VLLPPAETPLAEPLLHTGFRQVTELLALRHDLHDLPTATAPSLRYERYDRADPLLFAQTLLQTYEGTLDCPELTGVRTIEEILAGHRAAGKVRPELWWLVWAEDRPIGVLLLTDLPHGLDWDLAYLGIIPAARGRGLGRTLALEALHTARRNAVLHLILAVDARNAPALRLYQSLGFSIVEKRVVYLYFFPQSPGRDGRPERAEDDHGAAAE
jgi:ribosomal protein S18 acetylase RimI-like enzyme